MPLFKDGTDLSADTGYLMRWRYRRTPSQEPVQLPRRHYGCEYRYHNHLNPLKCKLSGPSLPDIGVTMREGMQGMVVDFKDCFAHVRLSNVTYNDETANVLVPTWMLQGGSKPFYDQGAWRLNAKMPVPSFPMPPPRPT